MDLSQSRPDPLVASLSEPQPKRDAAVLPQLYDILAHRAVVLWFLLSAASVAYGVATEAAGVDLAHPGAIPVRVIADLLSRASLFVFLLNAAWLSMVRSKPLAKAPGIMPRIVATLGMCLIYGIPFLPRLENAPAWLLFLSAALAAIGNLLAAIVLSRLGKSFSVMSEARRLVTSGPYRFVRHPLYFSEEIAIIGCFLPYWSLPGLALFAAHLAAQIVRMGNEERVLRATFPEYEDYARRTRRLIPGIW